MQLLTLIFYKKLALSKFSIKKESIAVLSDQGLSEVKGGEMSACVHFTCRICTSLRDSKMVDEEFKD